MKCLASQQTVSFHILLLLLLASLAFLATRVLKQQQALLAHIRY